MGNSILRAREREKRLKRTSYRSLAQERAQIARTISGVFTITHGHFPLFWASEILCRFHHIVLEISIEARLTSN